MEDDDEFEAIPPAQADDAQEAGADAPEAEDKEPYRFEDWALI